MGIQAASVGAGMVVVTTIGGMLGSHGFKNAYFINIIGFVCMAIIALFLPETGKVKVTNTEKIRLTKEVFAVSLFGMLEFLFLMSFTTNIAMHLVGTLKGNTAMSGVLTGIFSCSQIVMGLIWGFITRITKKYTLPVAMLSFSLGEMSTTNVYIVAVVGMTLVAIIAFVWKKAKTNFKIKIESSELSLIRRKDYEQ